MSIIESDLFQRLRQNTPFSIAEFLTLIATAPRRYKDHTIDKRNGRGTRLISQPTKELKFLQRTLISTELSDLPVHKAAVAYRKELSIKHHALPHAHARYLLKLDFTDFFPSITDNAIIRCLSLDRTYTEVELKIITNILCRRSKGALPLKLSIGAPSSPFISNYVMHEFDHRLHLYCEQNFIAYTRYADDIALSTDRPHILDDTKSFVEHLLKELSYLNLVLNDAKTTNVSKKHRRTLVGLTLSNEGQVSIGRDRKRLLRVQMHRASLGKLGNEEIEKLRGQLAFLFGVDPNFVSSLCKHYGFSRVADVSFPLTGQRLSTDD